MQSSESARYIRDLDFPASFASEQVEAVSGSTGILDPDLIRFSQSSVDNVLGDGTSIANRIEEAQGLGQFPTDLQSIEIFELNGQIFSLDNRRLYIAQQAGVEIPYIVRFVETAVDQSKLNTDVAGLFVVVLP